MYESYFGLTERPFSIAPDPDYLYMSSRHKEAMAHLSYGLSQGGCFIVLTGEVGTGKTTLCRNLLTDLPNNVDVALILNANLGSTELLQTVCDELKVRYDVEASQKQLLDRINAHLLKTFAENRHTVLIIDEAQLLKRNVLEQVRMLTNLETTKSKLLQIILIGQPELYDMLSRNDLRQLAQRVTARYHLGALERSDIEEYVNYRLNVAGCKQPLFSRQALNKLHTLTSGIPRKINVLADHALLATYSQHKTLVDAKTVAKSAKEVFIVTKSRDPKPKQSLSSRFSMLSSDSKLIEPSSVSVFSELVEPAPVKKSSRSTARASRTNKSSSKSKSVSSTSASKQSKPNRTTSAAAVSRVAVSDAKARKPSGAEGVKRAGKPGRLASSDQPLSSKSSRSAVIGRAGKSSGSASIAGKASKSARSTTSKKSSGSVSTSTSKTSKVSRSTKVRQVSKSSKPSSGAEKISRPVTSSKTSKTTSSSPVAKRKRADAVSRPKSVTRSSKSDSKTARSKSSSAATTSRRASAAKRSVSSNKPQRVTKLSPPNEGFLQSFLAELSLPSPWYLVAALCLLLGLLVAWLAIGHFGSDNSVATQQVETKPKDASVQERQVVEGGEAAQTGGVVAAVQDDSLEEGVVKPGKAIVSDTFLTADDEPVDISAFDISPNTDIETQGLGAATSQVGEATPLGKKLEASGDVTGRITVLRNLALEWQFELPSKLLSSVCKSVLTQGMKCLEVKQWEKVESFNRPAVVLLKHNERIHRVIVKSLADEQAAVVIGSSIKLVSVDEIKRRWAGSGLIYWRPSLDGTPLLQKGDQGEIIKDIRVQLNEVLSSANLEPLKELENSKFDDDLAEKVKLLQKSFALEEDGLIGSETYLVMNEVVHSNSTPVLRQRVQSVLN